MYQINTTDETTAGVRTEGPILEFSLPKVTVATLIETRILAEMDRAAGRIVYRSTEAENAARKRRDENAELQVRRALDAFDRGQLIVLFPTRQAQRLDESISLEYGEEVTFLRLVPLIGG
jgi:uncharacterized protein (DUF849 family)